jgi:hypothetical protein
MTVTYDENGRIVKKYLNKPTKTEETQIVLFEAWNNYFKFESGKFFFFGKQPRMAHSIGSWFNCSELQTASLRTAILAGNFEVKKKIPGNLKVYPLPSEGEK